MTGIYYFHRRFYDSYSGFRFLNHDEAGADYENPLTINRFAYVQNRPTIMVDPDGKFGLLGATLGGTISAGLNIASQYSRNGGFENFSFKELAVHTGVGAVSGAVTGGIAGVGIKTSSKIGLAALSSGTLNVAQQKLLGNTNINIRETISSTLIGGVSFGLGGQFGSRVMKAFPTRTWGVKNIFMPGLGNISSRFDVTPLSQTIGNIAGNSMTNSGVLGKGLDSLNIDVSFEPWW
jgi:RHS repeat-associated protein